MNLYLQLKDLNKIRNIAVIAYPIECCGLLLGFTVDNETHITSVVPSWNISGTRNNRFQIDPAVHFAVIRKTRGRTVRLVGHYHSHPSGTIYPSSIDSSSVFAKNLVWIIIAISGVTLPIVAAYYFSEDGSITSVPIIVI